MPRAAVLIAEGFEEIEAITIIDVLRRADVETTIVGVTGQTVHGSHGIAIETDQPIATAAKTKWDLVALPGGMPGASTLRDDARVQAMIRAQREGGATIGAICAAPIALARAGVLEGVRATCYPGFEDQLAGAVRAGEEVVVDGAIVTSRGPATAMVFALALVAKVQGPERAAKVGKGLLARS